MRTAAATAPAPACPAPGPAPAAPDAPPDWLEALPHAAAIVVPGDGCPAIAHANRRFARQAGDWAADAAAAPLRRACADILAGRAREAALTWEQGGFQARVYEAAVRPLADAGDGPRALLSLIDRTTLVRSEATLRRELLSDSLTGLPNRAGFCERLDERLHGPLPEGHALTLLVIDLGRFSRINESIGALAGDELLLTVARRLRQQSRGADLLARIGGDEFALLCATRVDGAAGGGEDAGPLATARRIRDVFAAPFRIGELMINVDCAIGGIADLARGRGNGDSADLLRQAQIALKQAKHGGEGVAFYEPVALARLHRRFDRETALRRAIDAGAIDLAFQPLVDMVQRRVIGFEALARWTDAGEPVPPTEFVPIAEDSGLIVPLGRLVLDRAMATLAGWDARCGAPVPVHMSVNMSPIQLARDDVVAAIGGALARHGLTGRRLTVEVTESSIVENPDSAHAILAALAALDVGIAMDDFGTGYSNIASLQRLPIDTLKIDRSLVAGIDTSSDSLAIVRTIQRLGEALGMKTTAEGIETETVAQQIAAIGCDTGQGYLFSRPLDAEAAFAAWQRTAGR